MCSAAMETEDALGELGLMSGASLDVKDGKAKEVKGISNAVEEGKPWKQKKKKVPRAAATSADIEIYEAKVVNNGACDFDVTSPESGYLRIQCKDDGEFAIPFTVVECFECVDVILHGGGEYWCWLICKKQFCIHSLGAYESSWNS